MSAPAAQQRFDAAMRVPLAAAAAAIWIERALPRELGLALTLWAGFLALALAGIADWMPGAARLGLLGTFALASVILAARAALRTGMPSRAACRARLERGSGLRLGQLALAGDNAAGDPDAFGMSLWTRALADARTKRPRLGKLEWRPSLETRYGLWPLIGTALLLGLVAAKDEAPRRLADAFSPYAESLAGARAYVSINAPAYAGLLPRRVVIAGGAARKVEALAGSRASVRLEGLRGVWHIRAPNGDTAAAVNGSAAMTLHVGGRYVVRISRRTVASLDVTLAADGVPVVRFDGPPTQTPSAALRLGYRLNDDHGASALSLLVSHGRDVRRVDLETSVTSGRGHVFADLTPSPFAGETVDVVLVATDGAGQSGATPPIRMTLPERSFADPLARDIIAVRKSLLQGAARTLAARRIGVLAASRDRYDGDLAIFSGLRAAVWRLALDRHPNARDSVAALLWDIAIDREDGGASRAMDDLRRAMERLARGIGSGDDKALAALADQLEKAMTDYLRRQIEAALAEGGSPPAAPAAGASVDLGFLDQMFADLKDRLAAGDAKGAAQALANLRQLMETIRFGSNAPDAAAQKRAAAAAALARELRDIVRRQEELRDRTIADMVRGVFGEDEALKSGAAVQRELRKAAGAIQDGFAAAGLPASAAIDTATTAMDEAGRALARGDAGSAIRAETRALDALQAAANAADAAAERMAQMAGPGAMQPGAAGSGLDPLGRPGTGFGQGAVKLPGEAEVRRIQAIRKILEDRVSDPSRSTEERGYYMRLLKRF